MAEKENISMSALTAGLESAKRRPTDSGRENLMEGRTYIPRMSKEQKALLIAALQSGAKKRAEKRAERKADRPGASLPEMERKNQDLLEERKGMKMPSRDESSYRYLDEDYVNEQFTRMPGREPQNFEYTDKATPENQRYRDVMTLLALNYFSFPALQGKLKDGESYREAVKLYQNNNLKYKGFDEYPTSIEDAKKKVIDFLETKNIKEAGVTDEEIDRLAKKLYESVPQSVRREAIDKRQEEMFDLDQEMDEERVLETERDAAKGRNWSDLKRALDKKGLTGPRDHFEQYLTPAQRLQKRIDESLLEPKRMVDEVSFDNKLREDAESAAKERSLTPAQRMQRLRDIADQEKLKIDSTIRREAERRARRNTAAAEAIQRGLRSLQSGGKIPTYKKRTAKYRP